MSSANKDSFIPFFTTWMPFISSSCLIAVASTTSTMLNKRGKSGHPGPVSDLNGNACSFCLLCMVLAVGLSHVAFIMVRYVHSIPNLLSFYNKWIVNFTQNFFCVYWYNHVVLILHILFVESLFNPTYVVNHIYWFANVLPTLHFQNQSHSTMVYDLFDTFLCQFPNILLRTVASMLISGVDL